MKIKIRNKSVRFNSAAYMFMVYAQPKHNLIFNLKKGVINCSLEDFFFLLNSLDLKKNKTLKCFMKGKNISIYLTCI